VKGSTFRKIKQEQENTQWPLWVFSCSFHRAERIEREGEINDGTLEVA
jgi:hypothetical protein